MLLQKVLPFICRTMWRLLSVEREHKQPVSLLLLMVTMQNNRLHSLMMASINSHKETVSLLLQKRLKWSCRNSFIATSKMVLMLIEQRDGKFQQLRRNGTPKPAVMLIANYAEQRWTFLSDDGKSKWQHRDSLVATPNDAHVNIMQNKDGCSSLVLESQNWSHLLLLSKWRSR